GHQQDSCAFELVLQRLRLRFALPDPREQLRVGRGSPRDHRGVLFYRVAHDRTIHRLFPPAGLMSDDVTALFRQVASNMTAVADSQYPESVGRAIDLIYAAFVS